MDSLAYIVLEFMGKSAKIKANATISDLRYEKPYRRCSSLIVLPMDAMRRPFLPSYCLKSGIIWGTPSHPHI